jgi:hypothetical protein
MIFRCWLSGNSQAPKKKETPTPKLLVAVSYVSLLASDEKTLFRPKEAIATHQTSEAE